MIPIIIPLRSRPYVAPRCPRCDGELSGWSPPSDDEPGCLFWLSIPAGIGAFGWVIITTLMWLMPPYRDSPQTLVGVLAAQGRWLVDLLHRIY